MYRYRHLMVALSLGEQDESSIRYAALVSTLAKCERVTFLHTTSTLDIPEEIRAEYPDLAHPGDEFARNAMQELVSKYYDGPPEVELLFEVAEGSPLVELLRRARDHEIDMIIMGKRREPTADGTLPEKLARKAPCSVLLVPEGGNASFASVLVPTDFSENSIDAMDVAVAFASAAGIDEIHCLHAYSVPLGYYKTGKSYEEFAEIMRGHAEKKYQEYLRYNVCQGDTVCELRDLKGITITPIFKLAAKAAHAIEAVVKEHEIDLLIIGARGRRAAAGVLLGSVTEHQIRTTTIPILAVKKKGTGMSIIDALLNL
ncbi:MAG: universal stress protein [Deltaproteobacteria bacterium]|nr:universal stress protein [Deltaproteobacteria bacterium]